jgi:hypothetical protein
MISPANDDRSMFEVLKNGIEGFFIFGILLGGIGGCVELLGGFRSPDNPKLRVFESRLGRSYSEHPGITYHDNNPYESLDGVVDWTSGVMQERYGTNITQNDKKEFDRLLTKAKEKDKTYIPF